MKRVTTKYLKEQYKSLSRKYNIQIKEVSSSELSLAGIREKCQGCVGGLPEDKTLGVLSRRFCQRYRIKGPCILINKRYTVKEKISTLYHELGHMLCIKKQCFCIDRFHRGNHTWTELHAQQYALEMLVKNQLWDALWSELMYVRSWIGTRCDDHDRNVRGFFHACNRLQHTRIWKKSYRLISALNA